MTLLRTAQVMAASLRVDDPLFDMPADLDWSQLVHHADGHSLTPLLYATWRQAGLLAQLPAEVRRRMARAYEDNARRNLYIREELLEIHQMLAGVAVDQLVLKGWPLVEQLYPDPAQRVVYDHDFLVRADQAELAYRTLRNVGFSPLPAKDEWVEKHLRPLWRNDNYQWNGYLYDPFYPRPVELHLCLWEQGWRGLRVANLVDPWRNVQTCRIGQSEVQLLSAENTMIHLAMHFTGHLVERDARLNQLLDLARWLQHNGAGVEWSTVMQRAEQANIVRFLYAALYLARNIYGAPLPPAAVWQQLESGTPQAFKAWLADRGCVDVLTSDYRRPDKGKDYHLTFMAAHSAGERLGIVRFAMLPPPEQLMARYGFRRRWLGPVYNLRYLFDRIREYAPGRRS
ncbi:MAG: nucleotidyltransferase family protein [Anaerolineae bacterium]|nr:nucleotidyltransferase family protein [Anaerolineae bacterium]